MTRAIVVLFVVLLVAKLGAAGRDLFGDEAFYWMCGERLDIAFADHPFMTALLVRGGSDIAGATPFGMRLLFIVCGALLPLLVWLLARQLVGRRDAWLAAGLSLCTPVTAHLGVVAIPDVPLMVFAAIALLGFERATRSDSGVAWLVAGLGCALALSTHLRGVLLPFAFGCYLVLTRAGRANLGSWKAWGALVVAGAGLLPVILYNVRLDWAPLKYQGADRHGGVDVDGLLVHLPAQAAVVTPLLYIACICALVSLLRRWRAGDDRAALCAIFALSHLGVFFLTSPVADSSHATVHWPAPGYLPLLVFVPGLLRDWVARVAPESRRGRRVMAALVPAVGLAGILYVFLEWSTGWPGYGPLHRPFAGWKDAVAATARHLGEIPPGPDGRVLVVADDYLLAGNLEMRLGPEIEVFVLDHPKNIEHGRQSQFAIWRLDEAGLSERRAGRDALLVFDRDQSRNSAWDEWRAHGESLFAGTEWLESVYSNGGRRPEKPRFVLVKGLRVE